MRFLAVLIFAAATALAAPATLPGVVDTVGGTTYDNQNSGPSLQMLVNAPGTGIHVAWTYSAQPQGSNWPDRTMNYNFFDASTAEWNWLDSAGFMNSGLNSQFRKTGYGTLETDPTDGAAIVGCHYNTGGMPPNFAITATRDLAPGAGIFDECVGAPTLTGYFLGVVGATSDRTLHLALIKFQASDNLYYGRSVSWCDWLTPVGWSVTGAYGHNLVASHASNKVLATWMSGNNDSAGLYYRFSTDAGENWDPAVQIDPPSAFGGDTGTVCARGAGLLFDADDNWLLATTLLPVVGDSAYENPAQLWMYNSATATWQRVHSAGAEALAGGFGGHAAICDRPSLGQNPATGRLYAAWEQFDSMNVEPRTNLLRADVWLSWSDDGGASWSEPAQLTEPDNSSKRFPHIGADCSGDSVAVVFVQDVIAGFNVDEVGSASNNPVCVWHGTGTGVAERGVRTAGRTEARPNPGTRFFLKLPTSGREPVQVEIYDVRGTVVHRGRTTGVQYDWDGIDDTGRLVAPGCYLLRWTTRSGAGQTKLAVAR